MWCCNTTDTVFGKYPFVQERGKLHNLTCSSFNSALISGISEDILELGENKGCSESIVVLIGVYNKTNLFTLNTKSFCGILDL